MQGAAPRGSSCQEGVPLVHGNGSDKLLKVSRSWADLTSWYDDLDLGEEQRKIPGLRLATLRERRD